MSTKDDGLESLRRWLDNHAKVGHWKGSELRLSSDFDTGRGLLTLGGIAAGTPLVAIPFSALLTRDVVVDSIPGADALVGEQQVLTLGLIAARLDPSAWSHWDPYLQSLSSLTFDTLPLSMSTDLQQLLPWNVQETVASHESSLERDYAAVQALEWPFGNIPRDLYEWAWCVVRTRCVTLCSNDRQGTGNNFFTKSSKPYPTIALAPFLDLLNHSPEAQTGAFLDPLTQTFTVITKSHIPPNSQVYISYGPHDNAFLLAEYGFLCASGSSAANPYNFVAFKWDLGPGRCRDLLQDYGLLGGYRLQKDEPGGAPYRFLNALRLYILIHSQTPKSKNQKQNQKDLERLIADWKGVQRGERDTVSAENERLVKDFLQAIYEKRLQSNQISLDRIREMEMQSRTGPVKWTPDQVFLIRTLIEQEQDILQSALAALSSNDT